MEATTIEDIVARAGIAKGTFYHHFKSKVALLAALRARFIEDFTDRLAAALASRPEDDWSGRLTVWVSALVTGYVDQLKLHDIIFHGPHEPLRQAMTDLPFMRQLAALLEGGAAAGVWTVDDAERVATVIFHGTHGAVDERLVKGGDPAAHAAALGALFNAMVAKR